MKWRRPNSAAAMLLFGLLETHAALAEDTLEEIVVTATKQGETAAQQTPLALTVLSNADLDAANIAGVRNLTLLSPGLVFSNNGQWAELYIRGIGSNNVFPGSDPSTSLYLDGVYLARPLMAFADFVDVSRVEVLRGPQGTLYGRNSAGGTINIITKQPTEQSQLTLEAEYGKFGERKFGGSVSGPLIGDSLLGSISFVRKDSDGYVRNLNAVGSPAHLNDDNSTGVRGTLRVLGDARAEFSLSGDYFGTRDHGNAGKPFLTDVHGNPITVPPQFSPTAIADPWTVSATPGLALLEETETWGVTGKGLIHLSPHLQLSSITAYRAIHFDNLGTDQDWTDVDAEHGDLHESQNQFSEELQLTGTSERLKWLSGLYYLTERDTQRVAGALPMTGLLEFGTPDLLGFNYGHVATTAWAAYANGTYALTEKLSLTTGIRYSRERKSAVATSNVTINGIDPGFGGFANQGRAEWSAWTPKLGLDYQWDEDRLVYASITRGFKSGGFNITANQPPFNPEYIWAYEVGIKSEWLARRLRANASTFYYDYKDLQVQGFLDNGTGNPGTSLRNAANATVKGGELELEALPLDSVRLSATAAYLDATYNDFITARSTTPTLPVDVSGNTLINAPKWAFGFSASYSVPVANSGTLVLSAGYKWQDEIFFTEFNDPGNRQKPYGLLNGQIGFTTGDGQWHFAVFGTNLTDKVYYTGTTDFSPLGVVGYITEPRYIGAKVTFNK